MRTIIGQLPPRLAINRCLGACPLTPLDQRPIRQLKKLTRGGHVIYEMLGKIAPSAENGSGKVSASCTSSNCGRIIGRSFVRIAWRERVRTLLGNASNAGIHW